MNLPVRELFALDRARSALATSYPHARVMNSGRGFTLSLATPAGCHFPLARRFCTNAR